MRQKLLALSVLAVALLLASGCSQDIGTYNAALDADRNAREKMTAALNLMAEADALAELTDEEAIATAAAKREGALAAYEEAVTFWIDAKRLYETLVQEEPDNGDYNNNLGNMIYFKIMSGLEGDYEGARQYLQAAIAISDRPIYQRNLELLEELRAGDEANEQMRENRRLVAQIKELAGV